LPYSAYDAERKFAVGEVRAEESPPCQSGLVLQGKLKPDFTGWSCPAPLRDYPEIVMAHGGGGKLTQELVENLLLPLFGGGGRDASGRGTGAGAD
jgi:hypothetical protein